jgi:hypothetical protein
MREGDLFVDLYTVTTGVVRCNGLILSADDGQAELAILTSSPSRLEISSVTLTVLVFAMVGLNDLTSLLGSSASHPAEVPSVGGRAPPLEGIDYSARPHGESARA